MVVTTNEAGKAYKTIASKKTKTSINLLSNVWQMFHSYPDQRPVKITTKTSCTKLQEDFWHFMKFYQYVVKSWNWKSFRASLT